MGRKGAHIPLSKLVLFVFVFVLVLGFSSLLMMMFVLVALYLPRFFSCQRTLTSTSTLAPHARRVTSSNKHHATRNTQHMTPDNKTQETRNDKRTTGTATSTDTGNRPRMPDGPPRSKAEQNRAGRAEHRCAMLDVRCAMAVAQFSVHCSLFLVWAVRRSTAPSPRTTSIASASASCALFWCSNFLVFCCSAAL